MPSDYGSLLALDSFAGRESIRIAVYSRAMAFSALLAASRQSAESVADALVAFVGDERWRLDALDVALAHANRRMTTEALVASAQEICDWALRGTAPAPPVEPAPLPQPTAVAKPAAPTLSKKVTRRLKNS